MLSATRVSELLNLLDDGEIVRRVTGGETELFELLIRRHNQRLFRLARAVLRRDDEAEDVVQEAYVRAYRHLGQFDGRAAFSTWLTRIALNEALARRRKGSRTVLTDPDGLEEIHSMSERPRSFPGPEEETVRRELLAILTRAVDALREPLRLVYVLREAEGLSTEETARVLGLTPEAVKVRLHRARAALRKEIGRSVDSQSARLFAFRGDRCNRMVTVVLARLRGAESDASPDAPAPRSG